MPDDVTDEQAALCEPCAVTVHAVRLSDIKLGDAVVVLGAGPIGLLCMQTARAAGATTVIVSEPAPGRAEAARRLGADAVFNPLDGNLEEQVLELTAGVGPQVVFECAAAPSTMEQALDLAARGRPGGNAGNSMGTDSRAPSQLDGPRSPNAIVLWHPARGLAHCPGTDAHWPGLR